MSDEKAKVIRYATRFHSNENQLHCQTCDFKIEKTSVDFGTCPIIAALSAAGIQQKFNIDTIISLDIDVELPNGIVPQPLLNAATICKTCELRHRERGSN